MLKLCKKINRLKTKVVTEIQMKCKKTTTLTTLTINPSRTTLLHSSTHTHKNSF